MIASRTPWIAVAGCTLLTLPTPGLAIDSTSLEFGAGDHTKMVRAGLQWKWQRQWWKSNGTHLGGYWDASLAQWRGNRFQDVKGNTQNITSLGITPVFRFQRDSMKGFYAEAGIGIHYLSERYDNGNRQLSTRFQFGDLLGIGYVFQNNLDVGIRLQHFSNGGYRQPNDGVNFAFVRVSYGF
ncbi:acyloxyacyl hydrolase [Noviherbaspirillum cavernae]|uniref:Lipid A deacylase n=1 Tax=Noviherbaspirillum cavernae TaxID=2320862 RepID=A0A418X435_9BURK|nr:acyloxyacyl hydrolase [Noviherbaspirillum cavernae]RJG07195.1 acyloxyacyl hydrolase [Noviherbaspirillum cavernae]